MAKLENKIIKSGFVNWQDLVWFQPIEIKTIDKDVLKKLETSLLNNGFVDSFNIWDKDGELYILDGHIRKQAMANLLKDGHEIPDSLPADWIDVKNEKEAKKLVLIYNSHYGNINRDPILNWVADLDIDVVDIEVNVPNIRFRTVDMETINDNQNDEWIGMPEFEAKENPYKIIIQFDNEKDRKEFAERHNMDFIQKYSKAWSTWYPFKKHEDRNSLKYEQPA